MYSFDDAMMKWRYDLPSASQWNELNVYCKWTWEGNGYRITGYNGNSIFLPASGGQYYFGEPMENNEGGYWTSTPEGSNDAAMFYISEYEHVSGGTRRFAKQCIRLVKTK